MTFRTPIDDYLGAETQKPQRVCDESGCCAEGAYPAPKNRAHPREFYWFCLTHVQSYNAKWDYYKGMSMDEIYGAQQFASVGERTTTPFRAFRRYPLLYRLLHQNIAFFTKVGRHRLDDALKAKCSLTPRQRKALEVMALSWPCQPEAVKKRFKELAKQHHPDLNPSDALATERFIKLQEAYAVIMTCFKPFERVSK